MSVTSDGDRYSGREREASVLQKPDNRSHDCNRPEHDDDRHQDRADGMAPPAALSGLGVGHGPLEIGSGSSMPLSLRGPRGLTSTPSGMSAEAKALVVSLRRTCPPAAMAPMRAARTTSIPV